MVSLPTFGFTLLTTCVPLGAHSAFVINAERLGDDRLTIPRLDRCASSSCEVDMQSSRSTVVFCGHVEPDPRIMITFLGLQTQACDHICMGLQAPAYDHKPVGPELCVCDHTLGPEGLSKHGPTMFLDVCGESHEHLIPPGCASPTLSWGLEAHTCVIILSWGQAWAAKLLLIIKHGCAPFPAYDHTCMGLQTPNPSPSRGNDPLRR